MGVKEITTTGTVGKGRKKRPGPVLREYSGPKLDAAHLDTIARSKAVRSVLSDADAAALRSRMLSALTLGSDTLSPEQEYFVLVANIASEHGESLQERQVTIADILDTTSDL